MWFDEFETPIGRLTVAGDVEGLRHVLFPSNRHAPPARDAWSRNTAAMATPRRQLLDYFEGGRTSFDLPLRPLGTPFQQRVWAELARIPFGETLSYAEVARRIGAPRAMRAVGAANGRNPLPIVLPCHRVIGANGALIGFGGGLDIKARLLHIEATSLGRDTGPGTQHALWKHA